MAKTTNRDEIITKMMSSVLIDISGPMHRKNKVLAKAANYKNIAANYGGSLVWTVEHVDDENSEELDDENSEECYVSMAFQFADEEKAKAFRVVYKNV